MPLFIKNAAGKRKVSWIKIVVFPVLILILLFELSIALAPYHSYTAFENNAYSDTVFWESFDSTYYDKEFSDVLRKKAFTEALLKLSEKDSINLVVNLRDSAINLYINGVKIHQTHLNWFENDMVLQKFDNLLYIKYFSNPIAIDSEYTTIVKEPIVVRQAPKDTAEAALQAIQAYKPDTLIQDAAFLKIDLENGISLILEQEIDPKSNDNKARSSFYETIEGNKFKNQYNRFFHLQKQEYKPKITAVLPANDLRAIYRALPIKAYVVINY